MWRGNAVSLRGRGFGVYRSEAFVFPPSSQHSCFAALAKNSRLWTVFTVLRTAASRQCDCHVASLLAMTEANYRSARFIMLSLQIRALPTCLRRLAVRSRFGLDCARDDEGGERYVWFLYCPLTRNCFFRKIRAFRKVWRRDDGVPPYRNGVTPAKVCSIQTKYPWADEERPYRKRETLLKAIYRNPTEVARPHFYNPFRLLKRCGVWDTVASVPAAFLLLFSPPEKSRFLFTFFLKEKFPYVIKENI